MNESKSKGRLFDAYRCMHEQGFVPIFVEDEREPKMLIEACVRAGIGCIEYTLRCPDANTMIPWIRQNYPDICLLAGSTLDDEQIVTKMRRRHPQLMTVAELENIGIDGFVSMIGWSLASIRKYSDRYVIAPTAMTVTEAFQQIGAGAHYAKLAGTDLDFIKRCRAAAAFDYCPVFATGGMTPERIPATVEAGAVLAGAGFDLTLKGRDKNISSDEVAEVMTEYLQATANARAKTYPDMCKAIGGDRQLWLDSLPHYHPF